MKRKRQSQEQRILMKPEEFVAIRNGFGLTQQEMGHKLGVGIVAVSHWEHGRRRISQTIVNLLRRIQESGG